MCGIIGAAGTLLAKEKGALQTLFYVNALRGMHGCGLLTLFDEYNKGKKEPYFWLKKFEEPSSVVSVSSPIKEYLLSISNVKAFIGHSRAATKGEIKKENNHPFKAGHIIGVHNGTIHGKFGNSAKFETDSEAFYNEVSEHGLKKALEIVHEGAYSAAYALVYYDMKEKTITLYRNKERPLFLAKAGSDYFWASEKEMLVFAFNKNGITEYSIDEIPVHSLVRIFLDKTEAKERLKIIPNYFTPKTRVWTYESNTYYRGGAWADNYNWKGDSNNQTKDEKKSVIQRTPPMFEEKQDGIKVSESVTLNKKFIEEQIIPCGCAWCTTIQDDYNKIRFSPSGTEYYCESCKDVIKEGGVEWDHLSVPKIIPNYRS